MNKTLIYTAIEADHLQPLGQVLRSGLGLTARQVRQVKFLPDGLWINDSRQVDGRPITTRAAVRQGDQIRVCFREKPETVVAVPGALTIVYEDEDLVFVDKPAGLVAHPAHGHYADTLVNRLAARYAEPIRLIGRLDKETSGLIGSARSSVAATRMENERKDKRLSREYLALVMGKMEGSGLVDAPLAEKRGTLMQMAVDANGKPSRTEYRVWRSWDSCSLVHLKLQTGRTHQIRVHMAWLGHPLLGDALYGEADPLMQRAALHSWRIRAVQPFSGESIEIMSLPPNDFKSRWEIESMNEYKQYMERLTFPPEAVEALLAKVDMGLDVLAHRYMEEELSLAEALEQIGEGEFEKYMVFLIGCLPELKQRYAEAGLSEELFWHTMMDLKYKLMECRQVKGVWGNFAAWWYDWFFKMKRFTLGRLQFEKTEFRGEMYERAGVQLKKGDAVVNMHIPSAGPLTEEARFDAYRQAFAFFSECCVSSDRGEVLPLVCDSWLLDPAYETFLPETSNILAFQRDFDIIAVQDKEEFHDAWRVFGIQEKLAVEDLPRKTSLQRAFAGYLAGGGKPGTGYGVLLWGQEGKL